MPDLKPTERFSNRVSNYVAARPSYPSKLVDFINSQSALHKDSVIADIGSGTGIFTKLLAERNLRIMGVEPNESMRHAAEELLAPFANFKSIDATAEKTTLDDHSVDAITAAQAFHWFDIDKTRSEFRRILKAGGLVYLIWNDRRINATPFDRDYEQLLTEFGIDYALVTHTNIDEAKLKAFFEKDYLRIVSFPNHQVLDFEALKQRILSCSYIPNEGHEHYPEMEKAMYNLFQRHRSEGVVTLHYSCKCFYGKL